MTETPTTEALSVRVKLDEASVKGLLPIQVQSMKDTATSVNQAMSVAGAATRSAMEALALLKRNVKHSNWTAFIKSGVLSVSAKKAADYVNSYDKWLVTDKDVTDEVLGSLSSRSLAAIANSNPEVRTIVKAKIISGGTSENDIRAMIATATGAKKVATNNKSKRTNEQEFDALSAFTKPELVDKLIKANKKIEELTKKIEVLKS